MRQGHELPPHSPRSQARPEQQELVLALLDPPDAKFAVADLVFAEAAFVMARAYGMTRSDISLALRGLLGLPQIARPAAAPYGVASLR